MIEGKKISELPVAQVLNEACCFPLLSKGATSKITFATLLTNILENINIDDSVEIVSIKESIKKMSTSVELTDKQIDKINNQITELNKEVDSQDALIVKYIKLVESLQETYDEIIEAVNVDSFLDESSKNPVQNKVIVEALSEKANKADLDTKVDKEAGKGLSTNDFTDEYKFKVDLLSESGSGEGSDNSNIAAALANKVDKIEGKGLSTNDFTDEDKSKLDSINNKIPEDASEENKLADKNYVGEKIKTVTNEIESEFENYSKNIDSLPYARIGTNTGAEFGYLRKYKKPKKIAVIGNSITCHGFSEHDDISWTVPDYREMASSKPNSGWVALIQQYITKYINPECKIYKANGSIWERGTEGSRDYSLMANEQAYEVVDEGTQLIEGFTIDNMLTSDTDIVLIQLCENMQVNDAYATSLDFEKLFDSIRDKCPKAEIYAFLGFWTYKEKVYPIVSACSKKNVNTVFAPNLIKNIVTDDLSIYKAQTDDAIYDGNGNQIATVSSAVSGHPNDFGFKVIATYFLDALFNNRSADVDGLRVVYTCEDVENPRKTEISYKESEIHGAEQFQNVYGELFECFILCGKYEVALNFPIKQDSHGYLQIECNGTRTTAYNPCRQRFIPLNANTRNVKELYRNVVLSDSFTTFGDMQCVYNTRELDIGINVHEQVVGIPNQTFLTNTDWVSVGVWDKKPGYIFDAYYIIPTYHGGTVDYSRKDFSPRILIGYDDSIQIASSIEGGITLPTNTILYIKYGY